LDRDNSIKIKDLGLIHSSSSDSLTSFIITRLKEEEEITESVTPNFVLRNWPPAIKEWSTKSLRDTFFASPLFPRLLNPERLKDTISRGVSGGMFAYLGKTSDIHYEPFYFETDLNIGDIEFSDDMFIVLADEARKHIEPPKLTYLEISPQFSTLIKGQKFTFSVKGKDQYGQNFVLTSVSWNATGGNVDQNGVFTSGLDDGDFIISVVAGGMRAEARITISDKKTSGTGNTPSQGKTKIVWNGEIPYLKWMNFYQKIIAKHAGSSTIKIGVNLVIENNSGFSNQNIEDLKNSLFDLGLVDKLEF